MLITSLLKLYKVWISAQGRIDLKGILQTAGKRELMRYQIYVMEKSGKEMRLNRQLCPSMKICCISDMEHLSMKQLTYKPGNISSTKAINQIKKYFFLRFKALILDWNKQKYTRLTTLKISAAFLSSTVETVLKKSCKILHCVN